jgi:hypothetical protein
MVIITLRKDQETLEYSSRLNQIPPTESLGSSFMVEAYE